MLTSTGDTDTFPIVLFPIVVVKTTQIIFRKSIFLCDKTREREEERREKREERKKREARREKREERREKREERREKRDR